MLRELATFAPVAGQARGAAGWRRRTVRRRASRRAESARRCARASVAARSGAGMTEMPVIHVRISGHVQGVGFRQWTAREARARGCRALCATGTTAASRPCSRAMRTPSRRLRRPAGVGLMARASSASMCAPRARKISRCAATTASRSCRHVKRRHIRRPNASQAGPSFKDGSHAPIFPRRFVGSRLASAPALAFAAERRRPTRGHGTARGEVAFDRAIVPFTLRTEAANAEDAARELAREIARAWSMR